MEQRVIKFRAWDKVAKQMSPEFVLFGEFLLLGAIHAWQSEIRGESESLLEMVLHDLDVMQFTGLKDKNGKEIYEGDILIRFGHDYYSEAYQAWQDSEYEGPEPPLVEVERDVCTLEHFRYWLKNETFGYEGEGLQRPEEWEIIGNIFEHPHLLNPPTQVK